MTKYTFLLPAYKPNFLAESLESIKEQTYTDFKVIVSDDCSPHDLKSIFEKTCGDDPRFVFRRNEKNMGGKSLVSHWNLLVDMCDTEWLIMAGDDDVYEPSFLKDADKLLSKYPSTNLLRGRTRIINGRGQVITEEKPTAEYLSNIDYIHRIYEDDYANGIASYIYRTRILRGRGGFPDWPLAWFSDEAGNIMLAMDGCCFTRDVTFNFRNSGINISSKWGDPEDSRKKTIATYAFYHWMKAYMNKISEDEVETEYLQDVAFLYQNKVRINIMNNIFHIRFSSFIKLLLKLPRDLELCKIRILAHYLRGKYLHLQERCSAKRMNSRN